MGNILEVKDINLFYQDKQVIYNVSINIKKGEFISLIGHNGAGKTTLLKGIFGLLKARGGEVYFNEIDIYNRPTPLNVKDGLALVYQEKVIFSDLSVNENLELGSYSLGYKNYTERVKNVINVFPILGERGSQLAGTLSGGEQRQLGIAMALLVEPKLLMLDEPSLGLSPLLTREIGRVLKEIQSKGMAVLLVEQNVKMAISLGQRIYVMKMGQIIHEDTSGNMLRREQLWDLF